MQIAGKLAVVTGAASGIGRATCLALADKGCDVVAVDVDAGGIDETSAEVEAMGRSAWSRVVDVSDRDQVFALASWCQSEVSGADMLVNNAGVTVISEFEHHSLEDFEWLMGINFWGVVYGCKAFLDQLRVKRGHIVNVSSIFGVVGVPGQSSYCSS
ncbi:MAG: SDR family NAD(P)-dependent oxidoreductase, partial [Acidimicrobiia bacterium]|nr:SDR family NAD(P)-dependent oxidoreductase [Acidimicrobiia bacterium]